MTVLRGLGAAMAAVAALAVPASASEALEPPADPLVKHQWHLHAIHAPAAWPVSRGAGVTVAVLDTGVAYENRGPYRRAPDLAAARIVAGWDFVGDDAHPNDVPPADGRRSHGTQIATIIGATAGNGIGGAGVAPEVTIMPVRVLKPNLSGSASRIARGLRFAADHGADVANLSIAGPTDAGVVRAAVDYAYAKGVTIVAAAGNDGGDAVSWPAADPKVIAVGALGRDGRQAFYSNYGPQLDLMAPGGAGERGDTGYGPGDGIMSQTLKGGPGEFCFCFMASTSAAAAQVSGVAALVLASKRASGPPAVLARLMSSARDRGAPGRDPQHGAGLVQAAAAVGAGRSTTVRPPSARPPSASPAPPSRGPWPALLVGGAVACLFGLAFLRRRRRRAA